MCREDTTIGQGDATFVLHGSKINLKCKHVLDFGENLIALSRLIDRFDVNFTFVEKFN